MWVSCRLSHKLTEIKGGWIVSFDDPPDGLISLIQSTMVPITDDEGITTMVNAFTLSGDIVIEDKYVGVIINTLYCVIADFIRKKARRTMGI